jgi:hypothetical protein
MDVKMQVHGISNVLNDLFDDPTQTTHDILVKGRLMVLAFADGEAIRFDAWLSDDPGERRESNRSRLHILDAGFIREITNSDLPMFVGGPNVYNYPCIVQCRVQIRCHQPDGYEVDIVTIDSFVLGDAKSAAWFFGDKASGEYILSEHKNDIEKKTHLINHL